MRESTRINISLDENIRLVGYVDILWLRLINRGVSIENLDGNEDLIFMYNFSVLGDGGMESSIPIGDIFDNSDRTVGFN